MDVFLPRPNRVWIGSQERGKWQKIVLEDPPQYCTNCQRMGHSTLNCKPQQSRKEGCLEEIHKGKKKIWLPVVDNKGGQQTSNIKGSEQGDTAPNSISQMEIGTKDSQEGQKECNQQSKAMPGPPFEEAETNIEQFLSNLGQFLEFINNQDRETNTHNAAPLALEPHKTAATEVDLESGKGLKQGGINVTINWDEGESSNMHKGTVMMEREILDAIPTILIDEREVARMLRGCSTSDLTRLQSIPTDSEPEDQEEDRWDREEDRWTEHSFKEEPQDILNSFLDKMDKCHKPPKQSKHVDALISPKASVSSGRKLRDRNLFLCYSEDKRWNIR